MAYGSNGERNVPLRKSLIHVVGTTKSHRNSKDAGNFARVLEGSLEFAHGFIDMYFFDLPKTDIIYHNFSVKYVQTKSRWKGIGKPTPVVEKTNRDSREFCRPPLSETTGRVVRKVMVGADYGDYRSTIPPPLPDETGWPGTRKKSQKRCRGRVSPAGQSNGLQDGKNDLEVAGVGASCSGAGYQFSLVWLLISGSTCATNVTQKGIRYSIQFAQKCGWETWGMLKSKNRYVVTITTPLTTPTLRG